MDVVASYGCAMVLGVEFNYLRRSHATDERLTWCHAKEILRTAYRDPTSRGRADRCREPCNSCGRVRYIGCHAGVSIATESLSKMETRR
uniref:Uncharacterized protein n=1 Tax=Hyaloperonospora arabidopsidis (strain Emoy2) TaxID=559515 RepID=M4C204_HYAAE